MHLSIEMERQAKERQEKGTQAVMSLWVLGTALQQKRFGYWFKSELSRFQWADANLHHVLRTLCVGDIRHDTLRAVDFRAKPYSDQFGYFGRQLQKFALQVADKYGIAGFKSKKFQLTEGDDYQALLLDLVTLTYQSLIAINEDYAHNEAMFNVKNGLSGLVAYTIAKNTLTRPTGNRKFETLLMSLTSDYLVNGFPHDILSWDADELGRCEKTPYGILLKREYCSSIMIHKEGEEKSLILEADMKHWKLIRL